MLTHGPWKGRLRIFAGVACALFIGWLAVAFGFWLTSLAFARFDAPSPRPPLFPSTKLIVGVGVPWMAAFPVIGFGMGLVCAFCWQSVAPIEKQKSWAMGLALVFFMPTALLGLLALCVLTIEFPLFLWAFKCGLDSRARWPHFFGLSNDWERDEDK